MSLNLQDPGTLLEAAATAPFVSLDTISPSGGLLVISPHPDDETLGCGQALSTAAVSGRKVGIVLLTDGEGSHPNSQEYNEKRLKELRLREFAEAVAQLAPDAEVRLLRLGLRDGATSRATIARSDVERAIQFAQSISARSIWSTWGNDPHCDHETAAHLAEQIADAVELPLWSYAVWGRFEKLTQPVKPVRFQADLAKQRKLHAMRAYRSQLTALITDDREGFVMPPVLVEHFAQQPEIFIRER